MQDRRRAFTLVELLVVIGIIALLAAILLPAVLAAIKNAHGRTARAELLSLKTAVQAFHNDYGKLPLPAAAQGGADHLLSEAEGQSVVRALTGADTALNTHRTPFLEGQGIAEDGTYLDPWDRPYRLVLDSNYDNKVDYQGKVYRTLCVAICAGPDGVVGNADDLLTGDPK